MAPSQQVVRLARVPVDNFTDCDRAPDELIQATWNFPVDFLGVFRTINHAARPSLAVVADAATNGVRDGKINSDFTDGRRATNSAAVYLFNPEYHDLPHNQLAAPIVYEFSAAFVVVRRNPRHSSKIMR